MGDEGLTVSDEGQYGADVQGAFICLDSLDLGEGADCAERVLYAPNFGENLVVNRFIYGGCSARKTVLKYPRIGNRHGR